MRVLRPEAKLAPTAEIGADIEAALLCEHIVLGHAHIAVEHVLRLAPDLSVDGAEQRLRPIVMTALATVAGMLPLAFALGAGIRSSGWYHSLA